MSHYTKTKWKTSDKVVQAGNPVKTRDVGIVCELLPAPPLRRLREPDTPVLHEECADTTFSSISTDDGLDEEDESVHDSFSSIDSEDLLEADRGDRRGIKFVLNSWISLQHAQDVPARPWQTLFTRREPSFLFVKIVDAVVLAEFGQASPLFVPSHQGILNCRVPFCFLCPCRQSLSGCCNLWTLLPSQ